jgi:hypothetical protein
MTSAIHRLQTLCFSYEGSIVHYSQEFEVHMKLIRLIRMCLKYTYKKVRIGKQLYEIPPVENGLKQGDILSPLL